MQTRADMIFKNFYVALCSINYLKLINLSYDYTFRNLLFGLHNAAASMPPCFVIGSRERLYRATELYTIWDTSVTGLSIRW